MKEKNYIDKKQNSKKKIKHSVIFYTWFKKKDSNICRSISILCKTMFILYGEKIMQTQSIFQDKESDSEYWMCV